MVVCPTKHPSKTGCCCISIDFTAQVLREDLKGVNSVVLQIFIGKCMEESIKVLIFKTQ